jgi:vitamin B12 transporter
LTLGTTSDDSTNYVSATSQSSIRTVQDQVVWQNDVTLPVGTLMASLETVRQRVGGTTTYATTRRDTDSVVLGYQASMGRHHLQLSDRDDRYDQFGGQNTHYAGYGLDLTRSLRVTAGTGTAFKAPSFNQLYFPGFGNPALLPETARNDEAGVQYGGGPVQFGVVHFRNQVANLIVNAGTPLRPVNVGQARITGTTFSASTRVVETDVAASLTDQDPRDAVTGSLLPRRARQFGSVNASRSVGPGRVGVELYAADARYEDAANTRRMGGYGLVNAYYEAPIARAWTAYLRADNLGDRVYETVRDFNVPGRTLFVGVRYQEN